MTKQRSVPRMKLWLERDGRVALSSYRARLLRLIGETGSLAEAAAITQLSYRRAWGKVREIEQTLGITLVQSDVGGAGGGKSRLTVEGMRFVQQYEAFAAAVDESVARLFEVHWPRDANANKGPAREAERPSGQRSEQTEVVADDPVDSPINQP